MNHEYEEALTHMRIYKVPFQITLAIVFIGYQTLGKDHGLYRCMKVASWPVFEQELRFPSMRSHSSYSFNFRAGFSSES